MKKSLSLLSLCLSLSFAQAQNFVLEFNGSDHVAVDSAFGFANLTQLSYSFWVKSNWQGANYIVDFTDDPAGFANPNGGFRTFIGRFNGNFIFSQYYKGANTSNVLDIDSKAGEYVHVACVIRRVANNGPAFDYEMLTYLNGVEQDRDILEVRARTVAEAYLSLQPGGTNVLGARFNLRANNFLSGQLDDFAVYNIALSETQIKDIACTGVTPITNRMLLYYPFNEGLGFVSGDSSGNAFNGQNNQPFFLQEDLPNLGSINPTADFSATNNQGSLFGRFQNTSINQDISIWDFGDGSIDTNNNNIVFHRFPEGDTFTVCLDVSASCGGSDRFCEDVVIDCPVPAADFSFIYQNLSFAGQVDSNTADSVSWVFGDGNTSSNPAVLHTYATDGPKTVCLYTFNNCGVDSICKSFDAVFSATSDHLLNHDVFDVQSNAASSEIHMHYSGSSANFEYQVYDLKGALLLSGTSYSLQDRSIHLDGHGVYLIELSDGTNYLRKKINLF